MSALFFAGSLLCLGTICASSTPPWFHLVSRALTWDQAQGFCRVKHSDLAAANNMADIDKLVQVLGGGVGLASVWIGLRRGSRDRWAWSDGHGHPGFTGWGDGEPNNDEGDERCTEMSQDGAWNDLLCDYTKEFVCYQRVSGKKQFVSYTEKKTWVDSQQVCRQSHADLATITSNEENEEIADLIGSWTGYIGLPKKIWIGLFRDSWFWSDGRETSFRFWLGSAGSGPGGDCAAVSATHAGRWTQAACTDRLNFVCEGALKVKTMVIRVKVHAKVDPTMGTIGEQLLRKLDAKIRSQRVSDFTLRWREDKHGVVFRRLQPPVVMETGCSIDVQ